MLVSLQANVSTLMAPLLNNLNLNPYMTARMLVSLRASASDIEFKWIKVFKDSPKVTWFWKPGLILCHFLSKLYPLGFILKWLIAPPP